MVRYWQTKRTWISALAASTALVSADRAMAQAQLSAPPPVNFAVDARGVDVVQGTYNLSTTDVVIGQPGAGGLTYSRDYIGPGWRDNMTGTIQDTGSGYFVSVGGVTEQFTLSGGVYTPTRNVGVTLVSVFGGGHDFTTADGVVYRFGPALQSYNSPTQANQGRLVSITYPNGEVVTLTYRTVNVNTGDPIEPVAQATRVQSASNNFGYQIKLTYANDSPGTVGNLPAFYRIISATGFNMAVDYCAPNATSCTYTQTWPSATYAVTGSTQTVTDQSSRTTTYTFSSDKVATITLPGSGSPDVSISYTGPQLTSITSAQGAWTYTWYDSGPTRTSTAFDPSYNQWRAVSNLTTGLLTSYRDPNTQTTSYAYDGQGRLTRVTLPEGNYVEYTLDTRGNATQTKQVAKSGSGLSDIITSATFPSSCTPAVCNLPTSTTDERGFTTDYVWNSTHGGLEKVTLPAPSLGANRPETRITYAAQTAYYKNSSGVIVAAPTSVTLPTATSTCAIGTAPSCIGTANEIKRTVVYGASGVANNLLPTSVTSGDGTGALAATVATTWTANGDPATVDGPLAGTGDTTRYIYDVARQMVGVIGPDPDGGGALLNRAMRMTYNSKGLITLAEQGTTTGYTDPNWAAFSKLQQQAITYDGYGRPLTQALQTSAGSTLQLMQQSYDALGRPECTAVRMNPNVFGSLPGSACTASTLSYNGPDRILHQAYDATGRPSVTTTGYASGTTRTEGVSYTANGLPQNLTDANGNVSIMVYDGFDRLYRLRYPNATGGGTSTTDYEQYGYDAASNVTSYRTRANQTFSPTYDNLNRSTAMGAPVGTDSPTYTYDNLGRMLTAVLTGRTTTQTWDALNRLTSQTGTLGTMAFQYDLAGRRTRLTWPDSVYITYDWNLGNDPTSINQSGGAQIAGYGYDNLGRRTSITRSTGITSAYGYDGISRLTSLSHDLPGGSTNDVAWTYTYNPAGQIQTKTQSNSVYDYPTATATTAYTNNGLNQVATIGGVSVTYDSNGNITNDTSKTYSYDARSRVTGGPVGASLSYDPLGRLRQYVGTAGGEYLYDGNEITGVTVDGVNINNRLVKGFTPDELVLAFQGGGFTTPYFTLTDERNSPIAITDQTGALLIANAYDEYGVPKTGNGGRLQYTGQLWLPDFGAYYYKARVYQPGIGRFLQTDPIRYAAGMNLYAYVGADPVNAVDPLGLLQFDGPPTDLGSIDVNGERKNEKRKGIRIGQGSSHNQPNLNERGRGGSDGECPATDNRGPAPRTELSWHGERMFIYVPQTFFISQQAERAAARRYQGEVMSSVDSPLDAYRHFYLSFALTQSFGPKIAKSITDSHEMSRFDINSAAMDIRNNAVGRAFAQDERWKNSTPEQAAEAAIENDCLRNNP